ncbi:MAG: hypothetical protein IMY79_02965 [Chloroflexi bacterium]|nr:hypothetical protein [Chloroflexota bacterium]
MTNYKVAFLIEGFHDLSPGLVVGERHLTYVTELSEKARRCMQEEVGGRLEKLWTPAGIPCIAIDVQAPDERAAVKKAWPPAQRIADTLALVEFERVDAISLSTERSPRLLHNALVANLDDSPPTTKFSYYAPVALGCINLGTAVKAAKHFNERVVRHLEALMPGELLYAEPISRPVIRRLAHSLHWYSQGMNQPEIPLHFLATWVALESLVIEDTTTGGKGRKIVARLGFLVTKHTKEKPQNEALWSLWKLRSDIVHEGIGGILEPDAHQITAEHINQVRYLYFVTLLFLLDRQAGASSLADIWGNFRSYQPSVVIKPEDVPIFYHVVDFSRDHISA